VGHDQAYVAMGTASDGGWERCRINVEGWHDVVDGFVIGFPCDDGECFDWEFRDDVCDGESHAVFLKNMTTSNA
jgi:hypothetical protein